MTKSEAEALAKTALPCPFCGATLVIISSPFDHTNFFVEHPIGLNECFFDLRDMYLDKKDMERWNSRTTKDQ